MKKFRFKKRKFNIKNILLIIIIILFFIIFIYLSNKELKNSYDNLINNYLLNDNPNYLDWTNNIDILINKYYFK